MSSDDRHPARVQVCYSLLSLLTQPTTLPALAFARTRTQHGYAIPHLEARPASAFSSPRKRLTKELTPDFQIDEELMGTVGAFSIDQVRLVNNQWLRR